MSAYLEQINLADAMLADDAADGCHRTHAVLAVLKEVIRHVASLQLLLLSHMAGGVTRHCRVVPEHQLAFLFCHCRWCNLHLPYNTAATLSC